jgi:hypothetical protein
MGFSEPPGPSGCRCRCLGAQALAAGIIENRSLTYLRLDRSLRDTPGGQALGSGAVLAREMRRVPKPFGVRPSFQSTEMSI